jgi:hypothetical protein
MAIRTSVPSLLAFLFSAACSHGFSPASSVQNPPAPAFLSQHASQPEDLRAIEDVLAAYPRAVSQGDAAAFEALLLNTTIAFTSTDELTMRDGSPSTDLQRYPRFRKAVFENGRRYTQRFYNVRIQQDGDLAHASLDFVTQDAQSGRGAFGWKSLQLLKVQGRWKIASEIYTVRDLPGSRSN